MPSYIVPNLKKRKTVSTTDKFARAVERLWYGRSKLAWLLVPFSWIYRLVIALRRLAYQVGLFRSYSAPVPVIVIGNITVGGTGKTPLVIWMVAYLKASGLRPGIVSRGYGGAGARQPVLVNGQSLASKVGDEPLLLAQRTGVPVCVCPDRVKAVRHLTQETDVNVIVTDDGLQHYRLQRNIEFVVIDAERGLGNGHLLPAGPLREPSGRLTRVNLVLVNGSNRGLSDHEFGLVPGAAQLLGDGESCSLDSFCGRKVWAVAGIGNPDRFYQLLRQSGMKVFPVPVSDHGSVDLQRLREEENWPVLMTEKDAVKYPATHVTDVWWVPVELRMTTESEAAVAQQLKGIVSG
ncbi:MAG: tetraacyldisaccharide 4'-kinase [Gammaproteobacteria bacterium]|nr:tetraacyldisaccharide 4'-kinase [Gammaproteobacteria bacterium]